MDESAKLCGRITRRQEWRISTLKAEWRSLHEFVRQAEEKAEGAEVTAELRRQALGKEHAAKDSTGRGAGESDSQEPGALAADLSDRGRE